MKPIHIAAVVLLAAFAQTAAGQGIPGDSLVPGTPLRVVLRSGDSAPSPATIADAPPANPVVGRSGGVFKGRFDSWDASALHVTQPSTKMSWSFPRSSVVSIDARTGSDRSRAALFRGALLGAATGAIGVFFFTSTKYHTLNPFAYGELSADITRGAAAGVVVGGALRYVRPPGIWRHVRFPEQGS